MIEGKSALLALWLFTLIACCTLPFTLLISGASKALPARLAPLALSVTLLLGAGTLLIHRVLQPQALTSPRVLSLAFMAALASVTGNGLTALRGLAALPLLAAVTWWEPGHGPGAVAKPRFPGCRRPCGGAATAHVPGGRDIRPKSQVRWWRPPSMESLSATRAADPHDFAWRGGGAPSHGPWLRCLALQAGLVARSGGLCDVVWFPYLALRAAQRWGRTRLAPSHRPLCAGRQSLQHLLQQALRSSP
jgi:hypothetical protein